MDDFPQLALDQQICLPLYAASRAVTRRYAQLLDEVGLTYPQYLSLLALWEADGPLSVGDLGVRLHLDSGTLTPLLKRMESAGLVTRARDRLDERRVLVSVTDQGRELRARVGDVPARLVEGMGMTEADGRTLRRLLERLLTQLERDRTVSPR
ncbi:MarR family winged helix-turn-helix transcriptional regulator [Ornithinimicrobium cerasi]|uniref:Transcriptional regulator, MarR family n=1 Tax=Ornithinimicrobium cerasi TaxID=2248773 RepID=A0A285VTY1_9MICO|nr:MarR family transcriptional regulator [Ornithinimicrobium cerasi]SOC57505.1 transcriptional regulator, MarR family [Ornithinimicrobium cerasi]SOC57566.1 DNA-binding transcriptional regulator, MarR family [Ornithinimicrobium cerasi]